MTDREKSLLKEYVTNYINSNYNMLFVNSDWMTKQIDLGAGLSIIMYLDENNVEKFDFPTFVNVDIYSINIDNGIWEKNQMRLNLIN